MTKTSLASQAVQKLEDARERFQRFTANLSEPISNFAPAPNMMTAAQQVAHVARVVDWFIEGAFGLDGFDMNFAAQIEQVLRVDSLAFARKWFEKSMSGAIELVAAKTDAELMVALSPGLVMGGLPRFGIVNEIVEHTAHHRGALTVYARLSGVIPPDPYGM